MFVQGKGGVLVGSVDSSRITHLLDTKSGRGQEEVGRTGAVVLTVLSAKMKMDQNDVTQNGFPDSKKIKIVENSRSLIILLPRLFIFTAYWFSLVDFDDWKLRIYLLAMLFLIN